MLSNPPIELAPKARTPLWKRWNCCLPSASNDDDHANKPTTNVPRRPFPIPSGLHHKELSLIVEETESKLLLEIESDEGVSKRSLASSLTSSSDSTGRVSSSGARSLSPPHDLMLTESTDDGDDDGVMGDKGGGDYDDADGGTFLRQISLRGSGAGGSSAAILELAWRVVVSIIFLGWLRKEAPPQNPTTRVRGRAKFNEDSSAGSSLPP